MGGMEWRRQKDFRQGRRVRGVVWTDPNKSVRFEKFFLMSDGGLTHQNTKRQRGRI